ncbi:uncharacterized protein [Hyperolius riggenbachi]|uniref:uncharacterized protein n=1 Tax=Hyperolius riggenbachi TaxID=752182 RepID=UPI0035A3A4CB
MDSLVQDIVGLAATEGGPELIAECLARAAGSRKATGKQAPKGKSKKKDQRSEARRSQSEPPASLPASVVCAAPAALPQLPSGRAGSSSQRYPAMDRALLAAAVDAGLDDPLPAKRTRTQKRPYSPPVDPPPTRRSGLRAEASSLPPDAAFALHSANPEAEVGRAPAIGQDDQRTSSEEFSPAGPSHPGGRAELSVGRLPGAVGASSGDQGAGAGGPGRISAGVDPIGDKRIVWLIGHSFIYWAKKRATVRPYSLNLGLNEEEFLILWFSQRGMRWRNLMGSILQWLKVWPAPDVVVLHLGGNDLGKSNTRSLLWRMKENMLRLRGLLPNTIFAFSEIIPRLVWLSHRELFFLERIRRRVNFAISKFMPAINGVSFRHLELEGGLRSLYRNDLVHLSEIGLDIFNMGLQDVIELAAGWGGAVLRPAIG